MMIKAVAFSNVGNIRSNHEDNYLLGINRCINGATQAMMKNNLYTDKASFSGDCGIFAVCDGMGGHASGEVASYNAVLWLNNNRNLLMNVQPKELVSYISELNTHICNEAEKTLSCKNMGCTLSALIINNKNIYAINAGDSRIYSFKNGKLTQLSTDHTEGQRLLNLGLLTKDELSNFPSRKALYKYLGRKGNLIADVADVSNDGGLYLICSDGLTDALEDNELEMLFLNGGSVSDIGQRLLNASLAKGNLCADNITLLLVEIF